MAKSKLDRDERALRESVERGEWRRAPNFEATKKRLQRTAAATLRKDRRVNIRISAMDLEALKKRAFEEGIPYQTLIASLIRKYVTGRLVDRAA